MYQFIIIVFLNNKAHFKFKIFTWNGCCSNNIIVLRQVVGIITRINLARYRSGMHKGFLKLEELAVLQNWLTAFTAGALRPQLQADNQATASFRLLTTIHSDLCSYVLLLTLIHDVVVSVVGDLRSLPETEWLAAWATVVWRHFADDNQF